MCMHTPHCGCLIQTIRACAGVNMSERDLCVPARDRAAAQVTSCAAAHARNRRFTTVFIINTTAHSPPNSSTRSNTVAFATWRRRQKHFDCKRPTLNLSVVLLIKPYWSGTKLLRVIFSVSVQFWRFTLQMTTLDDNLHFSVCRKSRD